MTRFPFADHPGVALSADHLRRYRDQPLVLVTLPNGRAALVVTRHADVKTVLADRRFSREAYAENPLFARTKKDLALAVSDPPTHTRRRRAVTAPFSPRRAEQERAVVEAAAERALDRVEAAGSPADLVAEFAVPFCYGVILSLLGLPESDLDLLIPLVEVLTSAGRYTSAEIAEAGKVMREYFTEQVELRHRWLAAGRPGGDVLSELAGASQPLSFEEIVTFGLGTLMAGADTTVNHLGMCLHHLLGDPGLADLLRRDAGAVELAVEELLRWAWVSHTGGQPHIAMEDVPLTDAVITEGQVVIPLIDAANRDLAVFEDVDEFRPDRVPNPHIGFGHGRHMCLGAPLVRIELQVALTALTRRFRHMELAVPEDQVPWRGDMFVRGPWELVARWEK